MSKKSVFKFTINNIKEKKKLIDDIITNYLNENQFEITSDNSTYLSGLYANFYWCLEYEITENQLVIKAYIVNANSGMKGHIHSKTNTNAIGKEFYDNIKKELFSKLNEVNIVLEDIETEKATDGTGKNMLKLIVSISLPFIILFAIITMIAYYSSH